MVDQLVFNGSAFSDGNRVVLTQDQNGQTGSVGLAQQIDLTRDFSIDSTVFLGTKDDDGADGLAFVFHNDTDGANAIGTAGSGLGVDGIDAGFGIEIDTYQSSGEIAADHVSLITTSDLSQVGDAIGIDNIEDGATHAFRLEWNAASQDMATFLDGNFVGSFDASSLFSEDSAYLTIGAGTGGLSNEQAIEDTIFEGWLI